MMLNFLIVSILIGLPQTYDSGAQFTHENKIIESSSGHLKLEWSSTSKENFEVQQSIYPDFKKVKTIYTGPDRASFISGLTNGTYYFRVRSGTGPWSESLTLRVQHQSLDLALGLFSIGAAVFGCTVWVVVNGIRKYSSDINQ